MKVIVIAALALEVNIIVSIDDVYLQFWVLLYHQGIWHLGSNIPLRSMGSASLKVQIENDDGLSSMCGMIDCFYTKIGITMQVCT